jgi:hypothetical protein
MRFVRSFAQRTSEISALCRGAGIAVIELAVQMQQVILGA